MKMSRKVIDTISQAVYICPAVAENILGCEKWGDYGVESADIDDNLLYLDYWLSGAPCTDTFSLETGECIDSFCEED